MHPDAKSSSLDPQADVAFDTLPVEIVAAIFLECMPLDEYIEPSSALPPLLFTRVSRRWRAIAFGMSELWWRLEWDVAHWRRAAEVLATRRQLEQGLDSWISRAADRSLSLRLFDSAESSYGIVPEDEDAKLPQLPFPIPVLAAFHRAHSLCLELPPSLFKIWSPEPQSLPSLRSLSAKLNQTSLMNILHASQNRLSRLHLLPASVSMTITAPSLRWLKINHIYIPDLLRTLRDCPHLAHLDCLDVTDHAEMHAEIDNAHLPAIHLPELEFLRLEIDTYNDSSDTLFQYLGSFPNLSAIAIDDDPGDNIASNVRDLLERSAWAHLRYLHYSFGHGHEVDVEFLNHLTVLEVLDVGLRYEAILGFFESLPPLRGLRKFRTRIFPELRQFRQGFDTNGVLHFINVNEQLRTLWIIFVGVLEDVSAGELVNWRPQPTFVHQLGPFVHKGLDFAIVTQDSRGRILFWPEENRVPHREDWMSMI